MTDYQQCFIEMVCAQAEFDAAKTRYLSTGKDYLLYLAQQGGLALWKDRYELAKEKESGKTL